MYTLIVLDPSTIKGYAQKVFRFKLPEGEQLESYLKREFEDYEDQNCIIIDDSLSVSSYPQFGNTHTRRFNTIQLQDIIEKP